MKAKALFLALGLLLTACAISSEPTGTDGTANEAAKKKKCVQTEMCIQGDVWSTKECKCVPAGVTCGNVTCGANEYCCSSSCGICEKIGSMCPAIACP